MQIDNAYRALQPQEITDPNGNKQLVAYNLLGLISAQAVAGKNGEGDTLEQPSVEYNYNLHCYAENQQPIYVHVKKRTQHKLNNFEESYVYTGGYGNMVMTKVQAESHPDTPGIARWVGTGRTVYNNKGKAIKQYEPYFSDTSAYDEANNTGGVALQFRYDPLDRKIKTIHPDGSIERIEFTPWQQKNYDQNDNDTTSPHYDSPQTQYFDSLGRHFITEDDNKAAGKYRVHQTLDIAGRPTVVTDAKGREMTTHLMGMQQPLKTTNIDSGTRSQINDAAGKPLYTWNSRGHQTKYTYDALQRPLQTELTENGNTYIVEKTVYGTDPSKNNIGQVVEQFDQSGKTEILFYDFKGNPLSAKKTFTQEYKNYINWLENPSLQNEVFTHLFEYDALNRLLSETLPDNTVIINTYNEAGLLETVKKGSDTFVSNINYNEKGQRTAIYYGNNTKTKYEYDTNTFRLTRLLTTRNNGVDILQDLNYTYDPVGNITQIIDNAQQTHYFNNSVINPISAYKYDALYRLIEATGRELSSLQMPTHNDFVNNIPTPNNAANAMQNYTQQFQYDELGNILQMKSNGHWTRDYFYATNNNQLLGHTNGNNEYTYDIHGNMLSMPHLSEMVWDYKDELKEVNLDGGGTAYYVYDSNGDRVRKVIERGNIVEERYYLSGYEVYRKTTNNTVNVERTTVHVSDDQKRIAMVDNDGTNETIRYLYDNHLGSASLELDEGANIISYEEYHPFGTTSYRSGRTETEVSLKRYKYVGKERDEETGLYYYGARYYASWLGRWTAVDPKANDFPSWTPYHYVHNNPLVLIDPTGMSADWYQSKSGNVVWKKGSAQSISVNGEKFSNIGKTYSLPMADGNHLNYFQDMPIAITGSKANVGELLAKNDGLYRNAMHMAPTKEMQSDIFMTRFTRNRSDAGAKALLGTLAVPTAAIFGLSGGVVSTSFWGGKAAISAVAQGIIYKGDIDIFDVAADAFLTPGAGALFGGAIDYNPFREDNIFNYVGNHKTIEQFGIDATTSYLSGSLSKKSFKSVKPYLETKLEKTLFNTVISVPSSTLSTGVNKKIKNELYEK